MKGIDAREKLLKMGTKTNAAFNEKLNPSGGIFIGVTVPNVKLLAKEIVKGNSDEYLQSKLTHYHEEILLYGLVISYLKRDLDEVICLLKDWSGYVCNWAQCDSVVMNMKIFAQESNRQAVWKFINEFNCKDLGEYGKRIIVVVLFSYFLTDDWADRCVAMLITFDDEKYYIKMALAWAISVVLVKYNSLGMQILTHNKLSIWVHNKSISKACDSFRITAEQKSELRLLRRANASRLNMIILNK